MNVVERVPGAEIFLGRADDVRWDQLSRLRQWQSNYLYFTRSRTPRLTTVLKLAFSKVLSRVWPR